MLLSFVQEEARPGYISCIASEYFDTKATLARKVKVLAHLIRKSKQCCVYTGAGARTFHAIYGILVTEYCGGTAGFQHLLQPTVTLNPDVGGFGGQRKIIYPPLPPLSYLYMVGTMVSEGLRRRHELKAQGLGISAQSRAQRAEWWSRGATALG